MQVRFLEVWRGRSMVVELLARCNLVWCCWLCPQRVSCLLVEPLAHGRALAKACATQTGNALTPCAQRFQLVDENCSSAEPLIIVLWDQWELEL